jgi:hypothetical protein
MKWVTREKTTVDRAACAWLIKHFVDTKAEFLFAAPDKVMGIAEMEEAKPFDVAGAQLVRNGGKCTFEAILEEYQITDTALHLLAKIVHGAEMERDLYKRPEAPGLKATASGFRSMGLKNDYEILEKEFLVYDALYAYCKGIAGREM